ncbi:MAG: cytochrome P460 family protein [Granulosicoccaceae bacterium]
MKTQLVYAALMVSGTLLLGHAQADDSAFSAHVDDKGKISFPKNFKIDMVHLGSWFVPEGDASGFYDVYTEKESVLAYRETGKFPDGATLVKELRAGEKGDYSTGSGISYSSSTELKQWFVMVKDSQGRFPDNPMWGNGWGWALFTPAAQSSNQASDYKQDCLGCHVPAADKDWVYTEAYPVLKQ